MSDIKINSSNCSNKELIRVAKKCGFEIFEGKKHTKVKTIKGDFVTVIPRHNILKKETVKSIVKKLNKRGGDVRIK